MFRFKHIRALFLLAALTTAPGPGRISAAQGPPQQTGTSIHLRWGQRPGVSRYRLQLAGDSNFSDIVFDRVITGTETDVNDLPPGRYFWRIAPLTTRLGEFSAAGVIEVRAAPSQPSPRPTPAKSPEVTSNSISAGGGWRAAVGEVSRPIAARLRSAERPDVVAANADGVVFGLDAASGVALWSVRTFGQRNPRAGSLTNTILIVPTRSRLDNVVVLSGTLAIQLEGSTGRELWRATLPAVASSAAVIFDRFASRLIIVDHSHQRLMVVNEVNGAIVSQINLSGRVIGAPSVINNQAGPSFAIAFDTGALEIRDFNGAVLRSGNASSLATTAPLFVRGRRGDLILVGTRDGLTAMTADDLRPLGRVSINGDAPRGALMAQDLDGDGVPEVVMATERRHLIAVDASDGKIIWDVADAGDGESLAFADINRDRTLDVFVSGRQKFALALSGRDGSVIWKDTESPALDTNHASPFDARALVAVQYGSGILLIAGDPNRTGLRAIAFAGADIRPTPR